MADNKVEEFVALLKKHRKAHEISHEKLAEQSGLSRTAISTIENGKASPTLRSIIRICSAMGLKPSDVLKKIGY